MVEKCSIAVTVAVAMVILNVISILNMSEVYLHRSPIIPPPRNDSQQHRNQQGHTSIVLCMRFKRCALA